MSAWGGGRPDLAGRLLELREGVQALERAAVFHLPVSQFSRSFMCSSSTRSGIQHRDLGGDACSEKSRSMSNLLCARR